MDAGLIAVLTESERLLVAETEPGSLGELDEDAAVALETRIRRARNKYVGQYRRAAAGRVAEAGGRGKARPQNKRAAMKAEAFEEALARVSRRVSVLSRQAARELRELRLAMARKERESGARARSGARGGGAGGGGAGGGGAGGRRGARVTVPQQSQVTDRTFRTPSTEKERGDTMATGARRQARRDSARASARSSSRS